MMGVRTFLLFAFATLMPALWAEDFEAFEKSVRPVLVERCYECHSQSAGKAKGGLRLDTRADLRKGGERGAAIVPGKPEASLLIKAVRQSDPKLKMPHKGQPLSELEIRALEEWIRAGAPDPRDAATVIKGPPLSDPQRVRTHWAFQPVANPPVPPVGGNGWAKTPVDAFVLATLQRARLAPSPKADKRTLIRRATFDLTGLPPTMADVEVFERDNSPEAFARVLDRLLASPQYGERWARHWLDVARYADNKGYVGVNVERRFPYSYTYRDYVVRAFNDDLPFDRFIVEQIAADKLELGEDKRALAALGYLTLGRRFLGNPHDIIDDRIDVVTRGFMGLTVTCARCHDHKYDPVPTADYYSLYGVFASSTEPDEKPLLGKNSLPPQHAEYLAERGKIAAELEQFKQVTVAEGLATLRRRAGEYLLAAHQANQNKLTGEPLAQLVAKNKFNARAFASWRRQLDEWKRTGHPVLAAWFALAELSAAELPARVTPVATAKLPLLAKQWADKSPATLADVAAAYGRLFAAADTVSPPPELAAVRQVLYGADSPAAVPADLPPDNPDSLLFGQREKIKQIESRLTKLEASHSGVPPRAMVLVDKPTPVEPVIFVRGNPGNAGARVPRQFLECMTPQRQPFTQGSGRLELARAIAHRDNPLTARVIVNRVWEHHFGHGLVRTPSDFGLRAEPPTHPELLDHLATGFVQEGWSLKKLHRRIMLSAAYQQGSNDRPEGIAVDPENRLLWKMTRQRLSYEAMHDSLLFVAGRLDTTLGGQPVDLAGNVLATRRSIYGFIDRQNLPGVWRIFDFANPDTHVPQRFVNTVPQQALYFMNSPFVLVQAKALLARQEVASATDDAERIRRLHAIAFQRAPTQQEFAEAQAFLNVPVEAQRAQAWVQYAQVLLMANEFLFAD